MQQALGEFELIDRYFRRPAAARPTAAAGGSGEVALGIGDDCALLALPPGQQLAVSSDMLVEGRHFVSTVNPARLGHKALAVNLSDLAACGAEPLAFTLALALPRADDAFLAPFAAGLFALADTHRIALVGGDTTAGPLNICITVFGSVPPGKALLRSGARAGDDVWVSGRLGDARLALEVLRGNVQLPGAAFDAIRGAMECPEPRVALGIALRGVASSAIDISDGLVGDLRHVLLQSDAGAWLDVDALPRGAALAAQPTVLQHTCLLTGGDDYELLFTAPSIRRDAVLAAGRQAGVDVTRCGRIEAGSALQIRSAGGTVLADAAALRGFDHFR